MGFIQGIHLDTIDSPADMARALRCLILDVFDHHDTRLAPVGFYDAPKESKYDEFDNSERDFLVADSNGNACWRIIVCDDSGNTDDPIVNLLDALTKLKLTVPQAISRMRTDVGGIDADEDDDQGDGPAPSVRDILIGPVLDQAKREDLAVMEAYMATSLTPAEAIRRLQTPAPTADEWHILGIIRDLGLSRADVSRRLHPDFRGD